MAQSNQLPLLAVSLSLGLSGVAAANPGAPTEPAPVIQAPAVPTNTQFEEKKAAPVADEKKEPEPEKKPEEPQKEEGEKKEGEPEKKEGEPEKKEGEGEKKEGEPEKKEAEGEKKKEPQKPPEQFLVPPVFPPLGAAGKPSVRPGDPGSDHFVPRPDRYRIGFPEWDRYPSIRGRGAPYQGKGRWWDPFNQNVLKADYPILGQNKFLEIQVLSDTIFNYRRQFVPSGVSAENPGSFRVFGRGQQQLVDQTFFVSGELFRGDTAFKPKDWALRFTPAFNINYLNTRERGLVDIDPRQGTTRTNVDVGFQELFFEKKIRDISPNYDFISTRTGIQQFNADFRGFLFFDNAPGFRVFGNAGSNQLQYNLAYFRPLRKDTYSTLNTVFTDRNQDVFVANVFRQDLFRPGYTGQLVGAFNNDNGRTIFDNDGIRRNPALIGDARAHSIRAYYLGYNGDGHFGRININHSFYQAWGVDERNPIAGRSVNINAQMAAVEVSYDRDWVRFRSSFFYSSGDKNPRDRRARGFDSIFDNPVFSGAPFGFFLQQRQGLIGSFVDLFGAGSLLPTLRGSRLEGQANFVNPGVMIFNVGADVDLTPKWRFIPNINVINFVETRPLELVLNQAGINKSLGVEYSLGFRYRPFLNDNVVTFFGASALVPGKGFVDIFENKTLFSLFTRLSLTF